MAQANQALHDAINDYNAIFGTNWGLNTIPEYFDDLSSRLNKTVYDRNYLDLVIVVDQLLTGFDAPGLNTLYVDRILKGAGLVQAYSRTNRIADLQEKPWGQVVNYRWPVQNERLMNEALATYANKDSANKVEEPTPVYGDDDPTPPWLVKPFNQQLEEVKRLFKHLLNVRKTQTANHLCNFQPAKKRKKKC